MEEAIIITLFFIVVGIPYFASTFFRIDTKEESSVKKRIPFFDMLRGIAILAVILIHVRRFFELDNALYDLTFLYSANNFARFAIPFFLICSGILLNPSVQNWWKFYKKKIIRIGIPYVFFSALLAYGLGQIDSFFYMLITGSASVPYYFMIILFQCYLLYPLLVQFKAYKTELLVISFFVSFASFLYPDSWYYNTFPLVTKYIFFFVYGFAKREDFLNFANQKKDLIVWSLITFLYIALALFDPEKLYNVRLFYGIALFNLFFFIQPAIEKLYILSEPLEWLGKNSLWIYLIHFPFTQATYLLFSEHIQNYYILFFASFVGSVLMVIPFAYILNWAYSKFEKLTN